MGPLVVFICQSLSDVTELHRSNKLNLSSHICPISTYLLGKLKLITGELPAVQRFPLGSERGFHVV